MIPPDSFDAYYYKHCCGQPYFRNEMWLGFFGQVASRIVADVAPRRVLDAGCALGFLVETLRDRGVEAFGIDISPFAIDQVYESIKPYCRVGSITDDLAGPWDLIVSIEVAEHMTTREAEAAIANICSQTADVIFSSSPIDHREPTHVNVHQPEYWAEQFARHGFYRDVDYDATYILPWAARFRKRNDPPHRIVRDYERRYWALLSAATDARSYSTDIQNTLGTTEAERDALRAERDVLTAVHQTMAAQRDEAVHERDTAVAERDEARIQAHDASLGREALIDDRSRLQSERDELAGSLAAVVAARDDTARALQAAETERDRVRREWEQVHADRDRTLADLHSLRGEHGQTLVDLDGVRAERDQARADLDGTREERDSAVAERESLRRERDALRDSHDQVATRLNQALDTIAHMEQSVFWRMRLVWVAILRLLPGRR